MSINISSFTAWITIEGVNCPIYGLKSTTSARDAACWIPSQEGKVLASIGALVSTLPLTRRPEILCKLEQQIPRPTRIRTAVHRRRRLQYTLYA